MKSLGQIAYEAHAMARGGIPKWNSLSRFQQECWEKAANAVAATAIVATVEKLVPNA